MQSSLYGVQICASITAVNQRNPCLLNIYL